MIRSALAVLALVILSGFALAPVPAHAQQEARTHEVREGDTLWRIAEQYYESGWMWTRIYEANRDRMDSPDDLSVGLVLTIPPAEAAAEAAETPRAEAPPAEAPPAEAGAEVIVVPPAAEEAEPAEQELGVPGPQDVRGPKPLRRRTAFYPDSVNPTLRSSTGPMLSAVSTDVVYSAPWLVGENLREPPHTGQLVGFAGAEGDVSRRNTARPHDRVLVAIEGPAPAIGTLLHVYRIGAQITDVGQVVVPTGVVRVVSLEPAGVVASVEKLYQRMAVGDFVGTLPDYPLSQGDRAQMVSTGTEAGIIGFANPRPAYSIGDIAFLDQGSDNGLSIGDEYVIVFSSAPGWSGEVEARLQVVGVHPTHAAARITSVEAPVFATGVRVRLDRKMR